MNKINYHLSQVIDIKKWTKLQDSLSLVTKMAIITVDYKGIPVTEHSYCQPFCQGVRKDGMLAEYCQKCDARGGLEAVRTNEPYIYACHFNIVDIAVPIIVEGQYVGAIMAGQIKIDDQDIQLEKIVNRAENKESLEKFHNLEDEYNLIPKLSYDEVVKTAEMLLHLSSYIVEESIEINKNTLDLTDEVANIPNDSSFAPKIEALHDHLNNTLIDSKIKNASALNFNTIHPLLVPAFEYIYYHKNENITLQYLAKICHISPSYFSRIFTKETGENFSVFLPRLKMEWGKQLLEETNLTVQKIADDLGYEDPGYFIKTFKKFENMTPIMYRKLIRNNIYI